jgi:type I restriction enzyme S subunit
MAATSTYSNYQPVRSHWVPCVPDHWRLLRAKNFLREIDDRSKTGEETLLSMRQHRGLVPHNDVSVKRIAPENLIGYKKARPDELVLNRMQAGNAMFFRNRLSGLVSPDYAVFRLLRDDSPEYLGYLFRSWPIRGLFRSESKGLGTGTSGFLRLYSDRFAALEIPLPPRPEQDQIVAYLRAQDAHIARFIQAKRELIALMAEQRGVLAEQAISSSETQHLRLDRVVSLLATPITRESEVTYMPIGMFNRGRGIFHKPPTEGKHLGDSTFFRIEKGYLMFSGQFAWEGAVAVASAEDDGCIASHRYPIAKCKRDAVTPEYLYTFFLSKAGDLILNHHSRGAAGRNRPLNPRTLLKEKVPVPPLHLQREVSNFYYEELSVRREIEKEIALIREYRDCLIADVVTGQVDVRGWQPGPEDVVDDAALVALGGDEDIDTETEDGDGEED